jgi:NPL4 family
MFKRGMLKAHETDPELVLTTKPVEIQRKRTNEIEGVLLITNVAIMSYTSQLRVQFPIENRVSAFFPEYARTQQAAKRFLQDTSKPQKDGQKLKFVEVLSDFHFLLFLTDSLDLTSDFPVICAAVREQDDELCSGYELLIKSMFGLAV